MTRHIRLAACVSTAALAGAAILGPVAGASARNTNTLLGGASAASVASSSAAPAATPGGISLASQMVVEKDVANFTLNSSSNKGLGPLLTELSQVQGIKGTQLGDDLATLGSEMSNESGVSWTNFVDGANKLQAESSEFGPLSTLFYNLGSGLKELYNN